MRKKDNKIFLPYISLIDTAVFPGSMMHFDITEKGYIASIEDSTKYGDKICLIPQKQNEADAISYNQTGLHDIGTICTIKQILKIEPDTVRIMIEGDCRVKVDSITQIGKARYASLSRADIKRIKDTDKVKVSAMGRLLAEQLFQFGQYNPKLADNVLPDILNEHDFNDLVLKACSDIAWNYMIKIKMLQCDTVDRLYDILITELFEENEITCIKFDIQKHLSETLGRNQKEYVLREQLKEIYKELGEGDPTDEINEYEDKLSKLDASDEIKNKISKEINRLKTMKGMGQEYNVISTYLDTVFNIPWNKYSIDNEDIVNAAKVLDKDHYGLTKVKERVIEYLAVKILNKHSKGPILCLVGPPGTGKTSIAQSVARALGKHYIRISLGGVRDEAEIRGHRKTYVGAMPGRFVDALCHASTMNPLMLLDEIDKISEDYKGATASALLEVLDSEQNNRFRDHYIGLPIDLSQVLFIATANTTETIPAPLLDRMEIIEISSYTENEKYHIAKNYLISKQMKEAGIKPSQAMISSDAIRKIIHSYTREAGVRSLERNIGEIYRKIAKKILEKNNKKIVVDASNLHNYLGKEKISDNDITRINQVGIVRGLAWTPVGGDTLEVEVNVMNGDGKLELTGQMGDVMKESARTALSCVRSIANSYDIPSDYFEKHDIHIHIPEGAVPKDGPSAGITMAIAMLSAITNIKVRYDIAMTGEITLRGNILPIGGLKEKILAAKIAKMKIVLVPTKNKSDIYELSKEITKGIKIIYIDTIKKAIKESFVGKS